MKPPILRCAVYTRKSSEEGLEQGFNSLHAQREACEAYVLSQVGEGWACLPGAYDDGGFSGGSMERPGLKALLADIDRGRIDVVVVYKVDRLTRSLGDFARMVEAFDAKTVSFVSVTQAFNTTTSMGRLTLNVLLSFAQFEREVTGERIRDKIAASKKKGMWMGGQPPLGYDLPRDPATRALVVNPAEAETVRLIFARYLELGSVHPLQVWLSEQAITSKVWTTSDGRARGGAPMGRGPLYHLLKNRSYVGEVPHRDTSYPGAHPAIVDGEMFAEVQRRLAQATRSGSRGGRAASDHAAPLILKGRLFDAAGAPMTPTHVRKGPGKLYRYYVSSTVHHGGACIPAHDAVRRASGPLIDGLVSECVERLAGRTGVDLGSVVVRVELHIAALHVVMSLDALLDRRIDSESELERLSARLKPGARLAACEDRDRIRVILPCRLAQRGGKTMLMDERGAPLPTGLTPDLALIKGLKAAHRLIRELGIEDEPALLGRPEQVQPKAAPSTTYERRLCRLAFLAPDLQGAILGGVHSPGLTLTSIIAEELPLLWEDQRRKFAKEGRDIGNTLEHPIKIPPNAS